MYVLGKCLCPSLYDVIPYCPLQYRISVRSQTSIRYVLCPNHPVGVENYTLHYCNWISLQITLLCKCLNESRYLSLIELTIRYSRTHVGIFNFVDEHGFFSVLIVLLDPCLLGIHTVRSTEYSSEKNVAGREEAWSWSLITFIISWYVYCR